VNLNGTKMATCFVGRFFVVRPRRSFPVFVGIVGESSDGV